MGAQRASRHVTKSNFRDPHELWRKCNRAQAGPSEIGSRCEKPRTQPRKGLEGAVQAKETLKGVGGQNEGQGLLGEKCRGGRGLELRAVGVGGDERRSSLCPMFDSPAGMCKCPISSQRRAPWEGATVREPRT